MKKRRLNTILLFALLVISCTTRGPSDESSATDSGDLPNVLVEKLQDRGFESSLGITGSLEAFQKVNVHAMESGIVKSVKVDIGDIVKKGSVMAQLQNPELQHKFQSADAEYRKASASLVKARALVKKAQSISALKTSQYDRLNKIYQGSQDLVTIDQLEIAKADAAIAGAEISAMDSEVQYQQASEQAASSIKQSLAERVNLLTITAPFSGVVTERFVHPGELIQNAASTSSAKPIAAIAQIDKLRLVVFYPEADLKYIKKGSQVEITVPSVPGLSLNLTLTRLSGALDQATKTLRAEIDIDNSDGKLYPGMYAKVITDIKSEGKTLAVNKKAITAVKNQNYIFKVENGEVKRVLVVLGIEDKDYIQVTSPDLRVNDAVVIQGKGLISDGSKVLAKEVN